MVHSLTDIRVHIFCFEIILIDFTRLLYTTGMYGKHVPVGHVVVI